MKTITAKKVWTEQGWLENVTITVEAGRIQSVAPNASTSCDYPLLVPGYIEQHVHGAKALSVNDPQRETAEKWLRMEAEHGVAALIPSPSTDKAEIIRDATELYADIMEHPVQGGAAVLGIHFEGPFINVVRKGGMKAEFILPPTIENFLMMAGNHMKAVKLVTLAPEMPGADELIRFLVSHGIKVNAGHSDATAEQMHHAIELGLDGVTHFFNATRPIHHREPGLLVAAAITPSVYCEMIGDLVHLAPDTIRLMVQMIGPERICAITDATPMTGLEDGVYGSLQVVHGSPRLMDGTLAGSRYLMDQVVQSLIGIGLDLHDVFRMVSNTPAKRLSIPDVGNIATGYRALLTALDEKYDVLNTLVDGEWVH